MKILLTGALGQLGTAFIDLFSTEKDITVFPTDLPELDISSESQMNSYLDTNPVDLIINCAAYNQVDHAEVDWKIAYDVNAAGPKNLASISKKRNILLVHFSTNYVFDGKRDTPYSIFDTPNPLSKYGESKLQGEREIQNLTQNFIIVRTSWLFGFGRQNFIYKLLEWSKIKSELSIVGDEISSPTFTQHLAEATLRLIRGNKYGLHHVSNSGYCSRYEWARHILDQIKWEGTLSETSLKKFDLAAERPKQAVLQNSISDKSIGYTMPNWKDATTVYLKEIEGVEL
jgi:dTDP-4-dehydrorhamnose reductase